MLTVGSYEAKTRLPELLRAVERGDVVTITRRGAPVARIVSVKEHLREDTAGVIARMKSARASAPPSLRTRSSRRATHGRRG